MSASGPGGGDIINWFTILPRLVVYRGNRVTSVCHVT